MITWMQRHKKWLVVTIWISTIAFVGAGFVGWGSYNYGTSSSTVAIVGDKEVSLEEYQREYSSLYEQYARAFGTQFNQEVAKQLNLENIAFEALLKKNLLLAYADELGLDVTNDEIVKELVKIEVFQKDGKFDKDIYIQVLNQNRTNPTDFEKGMKRDLLLQKLETIFELDLATFEADNIAKLFFVEDKVSLDILNANDIKIDVNDDILKKYWEENKNQYMSDKSFEVEKEIIEITNRDVTDFEIEDYYSNFKNEFTKEDGTIKSKEEAKDDIKRAILMQETKKIALKKYIDLKKGKLAFIKKEVIYKDDPNYIEEDMITIENAKENEVLKPFEYGDSFVVLKINAKIDPQPLNFEEAKDRVKQDYLRVERQIKLAQKSQEMLKNFKGKNIGYVSLEGTKKIEGLAPFETSQFLEQLFATNKDSGSIQVGDKMIVYKIDESRFKNETDKEQDRLIKERLLAIKNSELIENLIKNLETKYQIISTLNEQKDN